MVSKQKKQSLPKHEVDYVFVERPDKEYASIKLTSGPYCDIIYHYGNVAFAKEENENGHLPMKFDYDVLFNPHETDLDKQEFIDYIGDILIEQLTQNFQY